MFAQYLCAYKYTGCPLNGTEARIGSMKEVKENKKVLYHFAVFAIVNELLIIKYCRINPTYWLMQARDEMQLPTRLGGELFITSGNGYTRAARNIGPPF